MKKTSTQSMAILNTNKRDIKASHHVNQRLISLNNLHEATATTQSYTPRLMDLLPTNNVKIATSKDCRYYFCNAKPPKVA